MVARHATFIRVRRANAWLITILLAGLAIRLGWGVYLAADQASLARLPDQQEYLELGRNLLAGEGLRFLDPRFNDVVLAFRTPGYPAFVALCGGNVRAIRAVQAVIDASSILATFLLARRWLTPGASLLAAGLVAINPYLIYFTGLILSESLFAAMLIWGIALIARHNSTRTGWWIGAMLLALSVLVRPSAILLPVCLGIGATIATRGATPTPTRWVPPVGATMLILTGLILLPWAYRNWRVTGSWIWTTTNSGITLFDGFHADASGASDQRFVQTMPQLRSMNEIERDRYLGDAARRFIIENPRRSVLLAAVKVARTWSPIPLSDEYGGNWKYVGAAMGYMLPFGLMVFLGLCFGSLPTSVKVFLLIPAIYFTVAHAVSVGSLRYRIPADVPMAVIAAAMQFHKHRAGASDDTPGPQNA